MNHTMVQLSNQNRIKSLMSKKRLDKKWNKPKCMYKKCVDV